MPTAAPIQLGAVSTTDNVTAYSIATPFSPTPNRLLLVFAAVFRDTNVTPSDPVITTTLTLVDQGGGIVFMPIFNSAFTGSNFRRRTVAWWADTGSNPGTGTVTLTLPVTHQACFIRVMECPDLAIQAPRQAPAVWHTGNTNTLNQRTLDPFSNAGNLWFAWFLWANSPASSTFTQDEGTIVAQSGTTFPSCSNVLFWGEGSALPDLTPSGTITGTTVPTSQSVFEFELAGVAPPAPAVLRHHWALDEGTGPVIADSQGSAHGTLNFTLGTPWSHVAPNGSAVLTFEGTVTYVDIPDVVYPTGDFSLVAACMLDRGTMENDRGIIEFRQPTTFEGFSLRLSSTLGPHALLTGAGGTATASLPSARRPLHWFDAWLVLQLTYYAAADVLTLRVNRLPEVTVGGAAGALTPPATATFRLGLATSGETWPTYFKGRMGDVLFYDGVLTSAEKDALYDTIMARVNGPAPMLDLSDAPLDFTARVGVYDGEVVQDGGGLYTSITSSPDHIYVARAVTRGGVDQARLARYTKAWALIEDIQLNAVDWTAGQLANIAHRGASVAAHASGTIVAYGAAHSELWIGQHSTSPEDLSALTSTAIPPMVSTSNRVEYRRFFRHPVTGAVYLVFLEFNPGGTRYGQLRRWNDTSKTWETVGANHLATGENRFYGGRLAWSPDGATLYFLHAGTPNSSAGTYLRNAGVAKSVDDGATWTDLADGAITLPINTIEVSMAFPLTVAPGTGEALADHDMASGMRAMVALGDGQVFVFGNWVNALEGESQGIEAGFASIWMARWHPTAQQFSRHRLQAGIVETKSYGVPEAWIHAGRICLVYTSTETVSGVRQVYLLSSADGGQSWVRQVLFAGTGYGPSAATFYSPYVDFQAEADGLARVLMRPSHATAGMLDEVWEFSLIEPPTFQAGRARHANQLAAAGVLA